MFGSDIKEVNIFHQIVLKLARKLKVFVSLKKFTSLLNNPHLNEIQILHSRPRVLFVIATACAAFCVSSFSNFSYQIASPIEFELSLSQAIDELDTF